MERRIGTKVVWTEMPEVEPSVFWGDGDASRAFGTNEDFKFEELALPPYIPDKSNT